MTGGRFVLLPHDLWGADGFPISRFPGDNGDWTDYNNFLTRAAGWKCRRYIETTKIKSDTFAQACDAGEAKAQRATALASTGADAPLEDHDFPPFRRWSLADLRALHRITPME